MTFTGSLDTLTLFESIARECADIRTLRPDKRESLNWHAVSGGDLPDMMQLAYEAGFKDGRSRG